MTLSSEQRVEKWVRKEIRDLSAYVVPDSSGMIKLDAMENPYSWPSELLDDWLQSMRTAELNRYPDPDALLLKGQLRHSLSVGAAHDILLGNGSDELIQMIAMAVAQPGRVIMAPEPSFVMYQMIAKFVGMEFQGVPLQSDFSLDLPAMLAAIEKYQPAVIFLAYPNNPTGNLFDDGDLQQIIKAADGLVVIDEAYFSFAQSTFMDRLADFPNMVVMRTLSKSGLAGLRLGILVGSPAWIEEFDKVRLPYNINILTQVSAAFALRHQQAFDEQAQLIRADRSKMYQALQSLDGVEVFPSQANFFLFRVESDRADEIFKSLKKKNILVKNLHKSGGLLTDCLRVTVGTEKENAAFLNALQEAL